MIFGVSRAAKFWRNFAFRETGILHSTNLRNFVNFMFFIKHNFDWRKKSSTDSFVSDDPRVYEPACYEMMVGKVYYALAWSDCLPLSENDAIAYNVFGR